jgi:hypothetical protein
MYTDESLDHAGTAADRFDYVRGIRSQNSAILRIKSIFAR